jgi:hypothetical protein
MFEALDRILSMSGISGLKLDAETKIPQLEEQIKVLQYLRTVT